MYSTSIYNCPLSKQFLPHYGHQFINSSFSTFWFTVPLVLWVCKLTILCTRKNTLLHSMVHLHHFKHCFYRYLCFCTGTLDVVQLSGIHILLTIVSIYKTISTYSIHSCFFTTSFLYHHLFRNRLKGPQHF